MPRILMVVANPCTNDARVIKEAEALAAAGHQVRVLCRRDPDVPVSEVRNAVEYRRIPMGPELLSASYWWRRESRGGAPGEMRRDEQEQRPTGAGPGGGGADTYAQAGDSGLARLRAAARYLLGRLKEVMWQVLRYRLLRIAARQSVREFNPEVIHAHDLIPLPLAISAAGPQTKVVYDSHELETHRNGLRWFSRQIVALVEKRAIAEVDAVITVSPGIAKYLAQRYGLADPEVIFNAPRWPHEGQAKAIGGGLRERLRLAPSTPLIVYVGKLTFNRGLESVVHALPLFPEAHFAMVGPSVPKTVAAVRALAAQLDLSGRVHVVDPVPPEEVIRFVASADVGIIPTHDACLSYRYSMPNKLFEMTFAGLPICASDLPYQRKFLEEAGNGIIMDEESTADVARAMREAWNRREQLRPSPEQLERLAEKYAWSAQKAKLLALYARLLSHVDVGSGMAARSHA